MQFLYTTSELYKLNFKEHNHNKINHTLMTNKILFYITVHLNDDEDLQGVNNLVTDAAVTPKKKSKRPYNHHRGPMLVEFVENRRARQVRFNKRKKHF